jgi:hypothetical protein
MAALTSGHLLVWKHLLRHPTRLEISRWSAWAHLIHPQRSRHQREYPTMMDRRKDEGRCQTLLTQTPQVTEERTQPGMVVFYHAVILVVGARLDEPSGVGGEEIVVVSEIKPLRVPLGVI